MKEVIKRKPRGLNKDTLAKYIGKKFGKLTVLNFVGYVPYTNARKDHLSEGVVRVKCDCGVEKDLKIARIREGTESCGCNAKNKCGIPSSRRLELGIGATNNVYNYYKSNAKKRNLEFNLSKEQFVELTQKNCTYCNAKPSNLKSSKNYYGSFLYNGIDRIDSSKGYLIDNCTTCCKNCNYAKSQLTVDEFKELITNIYLNFIKNETI